MRIGWAGRARGTLPLPVVANRKPAKDYQDDEDRRWLRGGARRTSGSFGQETREFALSADKPNLDLGSIDLASSKLAKLKGKEAPPLHPTDARGVSKNVQIADYRGKWVALEFWGFWCVPCIGRALPQMMETYDDHESERSIFVILTVHSPETKTFADLDEMVKPVVRDVWFGRMIPFPILLDGDGKLQEAFGVSHWPTTILFDPDGKLFGEVEPDALEARLAKIPLEISLPRKLDRDVSIGLNDSTIAQALGLLKTLARADFELDKEAVASLGVNESTRVPLRFVGLISLRSLFDLLLDPLDLTARIGPKGYVITRKMKEEGSSDITPSKVQRVCGERIERKLKESKQTYRFDRAPLAKVAAYFEQQTGENVVLDPRGRLKGKINPEATITATGTDVPAGEALTKLVEPFGLRLVVRDEVIVLEAR